MKITVIHGDTTIQISGKSSLKKMKKAALHIFNNLPAESEAVEEEPNPIGFSVGATVERSDALAPEYFFTDDEE